LRLLWPLFTAHHNRSDNITRRVWSPHMATTVIGITFLFLLLMMGAWAYTDVLAELARGLQMDLVTRVLLLIALFIGALIGGWTADRFGSTRISFNQVGKCLIGGALMGFGSVMIPGSNDGLILLGMPLLWPYAWVAFAAMCVSIGLAITLKKRWSDAPRR
jgi:MFS family permease